VNVLRAFLIVATLLPCLLHCSAVAAPPASPAVAATLQPFVDNHTLAGAVTLVADRDHVLSLDAVGYMDFAAKQPMRTDCLFWIASMSKPMAATGLMMLVDEGRVSLDDPVEKYLPEFHGQGEGGYGLGWSTSRKLHGPSDPAPVGPCGHGGAYSTNLSIDPARGMVTVYMVQHAGYPGKDGPRIQPAFQKAAEALLRKE
jgi:CubicO group peptidase (beta-lactamase class C family)